MSDALDMYELVDEYMEQEGLYSTEGRRGVENLCTLVRALGYKDPYYNGQMSSKAALGDLVMFLEDNSGAIESLVSWIQERDVTEWAESLQEQLFDDESEEEYIFITTGVYYECK